MILSQDNKSEQKEYFPGNSEKELVGSSTSLKETKKLDDDFWVLPHYWLSIGVRGGYYFVLNQYKDLFGSTPIFNLAVGLNPRIVNNLIPELEIGWSPISLEVDKHGSYNFFFGGINLRYEYPLTELFNLFGSVGGGLNYEVLDINSDYEDDQSFINPYIKAGVGLDINIDYAYNVNVTGEYRAFLSKDEHLHGISTMLGVSYRFGADPQSSLNKYLSVKDNVDHIFPAKATYYSLNGIGKLKVKNKLKRRIKKMKTSVFIEDYMDAASYGDEMLNIQPDSTYSLDLRTILNSKAHNLTEDKDVTLVLKLHYEFDNDDRVYEYEIVKDVKLYKRNALTWEDTRNIGAFVTLNDGPVKSFSRGCITSITDEWNKDKYFLPSVNMRKAVAVWSGLSSINVTYVSDPRGFKSTFTDTSLVDFVQYPRDFLKSKTGDCDDFVVTYCSLLENIGVNTAVVTVPGHIFMAFDVGVSPDQIETLGLNKQDVLVKDNRVWLPLETTMISKKKPFKSAWKSGLGKYNSAELGTVELIPIETCQNLYKPISFESTEFSPTPAKSIATMFVSNIKPLRNKKVINKIKDPLVKAIAYARYKMFAKAIQQLKQLLKGKISKKKKSRKSKRQYKYPKKIIYANLGNVYFEKKDFTNAQKYFQKTLSIEDNYVPAVVGMIRLTEVQDRAGDRSKYLTKLPESVKKRYNLSRQLSSRASDDDDISLFWITE